MTTAKIAALQQIQGIQRFFKSPTVKDGILRHSRIICKKNQNNLAAHPIIFELCTKKSALFGDCSQSRIVRGAW
jgi:hypothetical protein